MILADLTEREIQECVKLGVTADIGGIPFTDIHAEATPVNKCVPVTTKKEGLFSSSYPITLISKA